MTLTDYTQLLLPAVEEELKSVVSQAKIRENETLFGMLSYHMGWSGEGAGAKAQGKRIRPLLLLLSTLAYDGNWHHALPAAAAVELVHNFSLIHDDIEDDSRFRRGRPTLWTLNQLPLALNAGDGMFSLAFLALEGLVDKLEPILVVQAYSMLSQTCLALTKGQHLDISFEQEAQVSVEAYLKMIEGKTAALLAASTQLGAIAAGADPNTIDVFRRLGHNMGIAFQIHDDYLGIWGDPQVTGKSAASDLVARKKSLPILFGLAHNQEFAEIWHTQKITEATAPALAEVLSGEGARDYAHERAQAYTQLALDAFDQLPQENQAVQALKELTNQLLNRTA